jgi:biotin carboxyl carrier protein
MFSDISQRHTRARMKGIKMKQTTVLLLVVLSTLSLSAQEQNDRLVGVVNRFVSAVKAGDYSAVVKEYTKEMLNNTPLNKTTIFFQNLASQYGKITRIDSPQVVAADQVKWVMYFERSAQDWTLCIDDQGKIKWFLFTTHVNSEPSPAPATAATPTPTPSSQSTPSQPAAPVVADKQQTELYLPFKGTWVVSYGGEVQEGSSQQNLLFQRYAYEFAAKDGDGRRYKDDGKTNEDYFSYGKEVLAPADGTVVDVIDGIRDNFPGVRNPYAPIGNAVIIQHTSKEYSVLAYLKQGSIRVKVGDKVTGGQVVALCGSSGNATEPVLHYHLQDSPYLQAANGVKFYFERAFVTSKEKKELKILLLPAVGQVLSPE